MPYTTGALLFIILAQLATATLRAEDNLVPNGEFNAQREIRGWDALKFDPSAGAKGDFAPAPEMISWEPREGADHSQGSLHLKIEKDAAFRYKANQSGARCILRKPTESDNMDLLVRFWAKSLAGSPFLYVSRFAGGSELEQPVELSKEWKQYEVRLPITFDTSLIIFNLVGSEDALDSLHAPTPVTPDLADGECLLDDVSVVAVPK